jgi:hypothetical protein
MSSPHPYDRNVFSGDSSIKLSVLVEAPFNFSKKFREFQIVTKDEKNIDCVACWLLVNQAASMTQLGKLLLRHIADNKKGDFKVITLE